METAKIARVQIVNPRDFGAAYEVRTEEGIETRLPDDAYCVGIILKNGAAYVHEHRFSFDAKGRDGADKLWARVYAAFEINLDHWCFIGGRA